MGIFKKGKNWYIDYYVNGRRKRECIGPSKKLAETVLHKRKIEIAEGKYLDNNRREKVKFEEMARLFLEYSRVNKKSWKRDCQNRYINEIDLLSVEKYKMQRLRKVSPATVNREVACLKSLLNKAVEWGKLERNPIRKIKMLKENNTIVRYLNKDELGRLIFLAKEPLKTIIQIAVLTGMRKSEILNLKWQNIDFERGLIVLEEKDTKNCKRREIPIESRLLEKLKVLYSKSDRSYVFINKHGQPLRKIDCQFKNLLKKAGIVNFRFHDLRHTFASYMVMSGLDLLTIKEFLGHSSLRMVLRYAHLSPNYKREAVEILSSKMDTIWTPSGEEKKDIKKELEKSYNFKEFFVEGAVAKRLRRRSAKPLFGGSNPLRALRSLKMCPVSSVG